MSTPIIKVLDPICDLDRGDQLWTSFQGAQNVQYKQITQSSLDNNAVRFQYQPNRDWLISRKLIINIPFRLTLNGTITTNNSAFTPSFPLLNPDYFSLRAYCLHQAMSKLELSIGQQSQTISPYQYISAVSRYSGEDLITYNQSWGPVMLDQSLVYSSLQGSNRNPMLQYGDGKYLDQPYRGSACQMNIVSNTAVTASTGGTSASSIVDFVVTCLVQVSPALFGCNDYAGFYGIDSLQLDITWLSSPANRMFSISDAPISVSGTSQVTAKITSSVVEFTGFSGTAFSLSPNVPYLNLKVLTPSVLQNPPLMPSLTYKWSYNNIRTYNTSIGTVTYAAGSKSVTTNSITLSVIPKRLFIYVRAQQSALEADPTLTDCFLSINSVSIQLGNQNPALSTASQSQLYEICRKNGLIDVYYSFTGGPVYGSDWNAAPYATAGTVLALDFGSDIPLEDASLSEGVSTNMPIQITLTIQNKDSTLKLDTVNMDIFCTYIYSGLFELKNGMIMKVDAPLSKENVLQASRQESLPMMALDRGLRGGSFLDTIGNIAGKVNNFLKETKLVSGIGKALSSVPIVGNVAGTVGNVADVLGYGLQTRKLKGGALESRKMLMDRTR